MEELTNILELYPSLIPSSDLKEWNGFISFKNEEVQVKISTPFFPMLKDVGLMCPIHMNSYVQRRVQQYILAGDISGSGLLHLLQHITNENLDGQRKIGIDNILIQTENQAGTLDYYLYKCVLKELTQIGSEHILTYNGELNETTLKIVDMEGRNHFLTIKIPVNYPSKPPMVLEVDLPEVATLELEQADTVFGMFNEFKALVNSFQEFWKEYDDIVKHTWVIDPEHPRLRDSYCRIVIGENVSIIITLNPQNVNTCPDIKFLGPDSVVGRLINVMENQLKIIGWNDESCVRENLLSLLQLTQFPQQQLQDEVVMETGECSICFMLRLEDQSIPTKVCNNAKCHSYFHIPCLAQWFQAVPTNETSFNFISGECPCCGEKLLCPLSEENQGL